MIFNVMEVDIPNKKVAFQKPGPDFCYFGLYNSQMGNIFRNLFDKKLPKKQCKVLMLGLDGAGKTTVLYSLKLGDVLMTIPTIGFNVE